MNRVAIALGSNLGDRAAHLGFGVAQLGHRLTDLRVSPFKETAPVGVGPQPQFLNGAVVGVTRERPRELLDALLDIERAAGRRRLHPGAPRTLDLDLILFGQEVIDEPGLRVPHPRFRERAFVLEPLAELAGEWIDPESGLTVSALWARWLVRASAPAEPPRPRS
ncbi:MAG: 2-amino-4-hydroxy-6-hydroxymethyldihydropteridine diphosphokinase [Acidobacteriota bacterium]